MPPSAATRLHASSGPGPAGGAGSRRGGRDAGDASDPSGRRCDFCGATVPTVRRVALDHDYDRLQPPHRELYACRPCSERKERRRLGLDGD